MAAGQNQDWLIPERDAAMLPTIFVGALKDLIGYELYPIAYHITHNPTGHPMGSGVVGIRAWSPEGAVLKVSRLLSAEHWGKAVSIRCEVLQSWARPTRQAPH
jgi:hypothetical protein